MLRMHDHLKYPYFVAFCWRRLRRAKSGGGVPLYFGDWIKISLAADFSKSGESPVPGFGAVR
jgi:hypothetical protein